MSLFFADVVYDGYALPQFMLCYGLGSRFRVHVSPVSSSICCGLIYSGTFCLYRVSRGRVFPVFWLLSFLGFAGLDVDIGLACILLF